MAWWQQTYRRFMYGRPIIVVSGLPRSGTSMMMKMLEAGGVPVWLDGVRTADDQNPKGYYELERVKELDKGLDKSWVREGRGRAVKVISSLLEHLPPTTTISALHEPRHPGSSGFTKQDALAARRGGRLGERCRASEVLRDAPAQGEVFPGARAWILGDRRRHMRTFSRTRRRWLGASARFSAPTSTSRA